MEVCNPKGGRTAASAFLAMLLLMIMIMMLLNAYCCGAVVLAKSNTSFQCSDGRLDECLIEEDLELELGFLMNPYVSRILADGQGQKPQSGNPNEPALPKPCGKPEDPQYDSCISEQKPNTNQCVCKGIFCRGCKPK